MATQKTDVVIVGAGAVGGIMAAELGKAGMKVIALERGPRLATADFGPHDELRYFQRLDLRPNPKRQPVTWRPDTNARAAMLPKLDYGNQAGDLAGALSFCEPVMPLFDGRAGLVRIKVDPSAVDDDFLMSAAPALAYGLLAHMLGSIVHAW